MEGMHVLLFVEFTKDHTKTSMVVKKITKELVEQDHDVTVLDTEAFDLLASEEQSEWSSRDHNNNNNNNTRKTSSANEEMLTAKKCIATCDVMLFISPKNVPVLPGCVSKLIKNANSVVLNRWCLQGVSCFVIAKQVKKASVARYIWKMLRKFESNALHNALAPWKCYEWEKMSNIQETALPSV